MGVSGGKNVRYSIYNGKVVVDTDQNIFEGEDRKDYGKIARSYMREHFRGKTFSDTSFTKLSEREYTSSRSTQKLFTTNDGVYDTKMKASTELDNMLIVAKKISHEAAKHPRDFNQNGYDRYDVTFSLDGKEFTGELLVAIDQNDRHTFYDIVKIKRSDSPVSAGLAERGTNASNSGTNSATNSILNSSEKVNTSEQKTSEKSTKERIAEVRERLDAKKIDSYLRENVKDYSDLGEANRSMIRKIVREGRAHGLDDADVLSYARVAARSGLNIEFDANMKDGEAGYFDPDKNRIVVNPKTPKKHELLLIHELDHAIRAYR